MHVGDQWELYIPAEMGYGKYSQPGISGGTTLIFDIELKGGGVACSEATINSINALLSFIWTFCTANFN